ncbi:TPA: hypothetical protein I8Y18_003545 [Raoultella ornithinolytica]|nr:hypothetical protein [Raoultella ornithinolytica]
MNDLTELAQREKFEAWWEREYKHLESSKYTDALPHIKYGFWMAYQAGGDELVEALEKAQATATQQGNIACALLDEVTQLRRHADEKAPELRAQLIEADSELEALRQRIAELESRTVKLPQPLGFKPPSGRDVILLSELTEALTAAGIKVEIN